MNTYFSKVNCTLTSVTESERKEEGKRKGGRERRRGKEGETKRKTERRCMEKERVSDERKGDKVFRKKGIARIHIYRDC